MTDTIEVLCPYCGKAWEIERDGPYNPELDEPEWENSKVRVVCEACLHVHLHD